MAATKKIQPVDSQTPTEKGWLTPKQMAFYNALMANKEFNIEKAAEVAGYSNPKFRGQELMKNTHILKMLGEAIHKRNNEYQITAARVLEELATVAFFNPQDALDANGVLLPLHKMPRQVAAAISSMKTLSEKTYTDTETEAESKEVLQEIKWWNKLEALGMLAKHVGLLKEVAPQMNFFALDWSSMVTAVGQRPPLAALPSLDPVEQQIAALEHQASAGTNGHSPPTNGVSK